MLLLSNGKNIPTVQILQRQNKQGRVDGVGKRTDMSSPNARFTICVTSTAGRLVTMTREAHPEPNTSGLFQQPNLNVPSFTSATIVGCSIGQLAPSTK